MSAGPGGFTESFPSICFNFKQSLLVLVFTLQKSLTQSLKLLYSDSLNVKYPGLNNIIYNQIIYNLQLLNKYIDK